MTAPRPTPGRLAQQLARETELRQVMRQLLELEPGTLARTSSGMTLHTALLTMQKLLRIGGGQ